MALDQLTLDGWVKAYPGLEDLYPATGTQLGLVFHSLLDVRKEAYATQMQIDFEGGFDGAVFRRAWEELLSRHAIFRTAFVGLDQEQPLQVVVKEAPLEWREEDWRALGREAQEEAFARYREHDKGLGFDFGRAPLMRMSLMRLSERKYRWLWTHHHSVLDGWSLAIVLRELLELNERLLSGRKVTLPRPAAYRDYIAWLCTQDRSAAEVYWQEVLSGVTPTQPGLPELPGGREFAGQDEQSLVLSVQRTEGLRKVAQRHGVTLNTVMQGAWAYLLHRYSGEQQVVFGQTVSGRSAAEVAGIEGMVGVFINTLPTPVEITSNADIGEWLRRLQQEQAQRESHGYLPLVEIQQLTGLQAGQPLFETLLVFENYPVGESLKEAGLAESRPRLVVSSLAVDEGTGYGLTLMVMPAQELSLKLLYRRDRFHRETIAALLGHLGVILDGLADAGTRQVQELPCLSKADHEELVERRNATARSYPQEKCIHELFEEQARLRPDAIALVHEGNELTYGELNRRANGLAHELIELGVGPEVRLGLCMQRSAEMVIGLLGILKSGGCYVPLDPAYPHKRLAYMVEDSGAALVVGDSSEWTFLDPAQRPRCVPVEQGGSERLPKTDPQIYPPSSALAYVIYTSGSTGVPKGVRISHGNVVNFLRSMQERPGITSGDRLLAVTTLSFDIALLELCLPLTVGATVDIAPAASVVDGERLMARLEESRITVLQGTPVTWKLLLDSGWQGLQRLTALVGGEALARELAARIVGKVGRVWNLYGPTETTIWSTRYRLPEAGDTWTVSIGQPIANTRVYVLDRHQRLVPAGVAGELYVGGAGVSQGYLNRPGLTAAKFSPNPYGHEPGERLYRTGDLVRWLPDGTLEFLGRVDTQVKVRGYRVELGEIESVLLAHDGVRDAVVVARDEEAGSKRLVGYVVAEAAAQADEVALVTALRSRLQEQLPGYMLPSALMLLSSFPLTANGKIDRRALPAPEASTVPVDHAPPEGVTEELLAELWGVVLKRERVGRHDSFFELGGHSLLAMQLVSRIREAFSTELPVRDLFDHPTLSSQARAIERARGAGALADVAIETVSRERPLPLSYAQQRLWFLQQYMGPNAVYNVPLALRLHGQVDEEALVRSLEELHRRHESLRTRYESQEGSAVQVIDPPVLELEVEAVSAAEAQAISHRERSHHFDLSSERLCRIRLLRETGSESGDYVLLVTMHHSVSDGWSLGIFFRELVGLYRAYKNGEDSPLAPLPIQYADYAQWQRGWLHGAVLDEQVSYWRGQLKELPPLLTLPTDRPRPARQTFRGSMERFALPAVLAEKLQALSREQGVTLFMTLLSGWAVLLSRYAGQQDVAVGTPIANRTRRETEGLIGFFVNTLVMRHDLRGDPRFVELLKHTRETALQAYAHQDVPFEHLVEELNPERNVSHSPLFQVAFGLVNTPFETVELPGLAVLPLLDDAGDDQEGTARFDLTLSVQEAPAGLMGVLEYNTDLFERVTIRRMLDHYERLLEAIVTAPQSRLSRLEMLGEAEKRQQLVEWNAAARSYPQEKCIHELFEEQARQRPDAIALGHEGSQLSYGELNRRANQLAHYLRKHGVGPEMRVGICMERSPEMAVGLLGILKAGGAYVPLDPEYPQARLEYMLVQSGCRVVLSERQLMADLPLLRTTEVLPLDADSHDALFGAFSDANVEVVDSGVGPSNLAYVIYTSGSTGQLKGSAIAHQNICRLIYDDFIDLAELSSLCSLTEHDLTKRCTAPNGRPIGSTQAYVLGPRGEMLPVGVVGELYLGGAGLARGYLGQASLTAEKFLPNGFARMPGERLYRTGDLARWLPAGTLEFLGPVDHQAKVPGFRIEPGEIESVLLAHEGVREAVVVALETAGVQPRLVAYVAQRATGSMPAEQFVGQLKAYLRTQPAFSRLPDEWVVLESFPLTANGKVNRQALPAPEASMSESAHVPPEGVTEELLAELWCRLLKRARVGRHDNFFELGGHSLLATQLVSRIREAFSTELPVRELFEHPTLSSQARAVERARGAGALADVSVEAVSREQPLPLSYAQQRLWFLQQYMGPNSVYNVPLALRLRGEVDEGALVRSLEELHRRHEPLRTRFEAQDGNVVQVIDPPALQLDVDAVSAAEVEAIVHAEQNYCFDLSSERLCRIRLLRESQPGESGESGDYVLLVTMHHSVSDGWSLGVLFRELVSLYRAYADGENTPLAPLPIQYADYAQWQRRWLQGAVLEQQLSYWREQLKELPPLLTLPTDRPRPAEQTYRGSLEPLAVPESLAQRLQALSREQGVTLYMTLLSAFAVLMGRYSGQQEVAIGTPVANRTRHETEGLIGFFVNMLVMREDLRGDPRFSDVLKQTREVALQAYAHQDIPFEQLVEELNPQRSVSHLPLFQVAFNLLNTPFEAVELPRLAVLPLREDAAEGQEGTSRFDMTLNVQESASGLVGGLEYNTDLFERDTIRRLLGHYAQLLEAIVAAPAARLSQLNMLGEDERHRQLVEWNARSSSYPRDRNVHELFEEQAARSPEVIAVVDENRQLTCREVNERANAVAHRLIEQGVAPGSAVGLCIDRGVERLVGLLGILKAGGAYVPLNPDDPVERLEYLLDDSGVELIVTQPSVRSRVELPGEEVESGQWRWLELPADEDLPGYRGTNPEVVVSASDLACVRYEADQAGGVPAGRMVSHVGVLEESIVRGREPSEGLIASLLARLTVGREDVSAAVETDAEIRGAAHYVLDRDGELLPIGAVGELYVGGEGVSWGYRNRSGLTAERFAPNAFSAVPGERLYRTGERARWTADGKLELVGRETASWRSHEKERLEIERALLGHEGVREAAVVTLEAAQSEPRLVAYVVERAPGTAPAQQFTAQLQAYLRTQPTFCRVPHDWMVLEALPRTAAGAVDRSALPQPEGSGENLTYLAPRTALESTLVEVWQEQLGIERIGVEDNYFALGGDSIRSITLVAQARQRGARFSVKDLFAYPTVSGLASAIERGDVRSDVDIEPEIEPFALLTEAERERLSRRHDLGT